MKPLIALFIFGMTLSSAFAGDAFKTAYMKKTYTFHDFEVKKQTTAKQRLVVTAQINKKPNEVLKIIWDDLPSLFSNLDRVDYFHENSENGPNAIGAGSYRHCVFGEKMAYEDILWFKEDKGLAYSLDGSKGTFSFPIKRHFAASHHSLGAFCFWCHLEA